MRLTSAVFVAALLKQAQGEDKFACLLRKGFASSGAIYVSVLARDGRVALYGPASQVDYGAEDDERRFEKLSIDTPDELQSYINSIVRFDSDIWHLEIESDTLEPPAIMQLV